MCEQEYLFSEAHFRLALETAHVGMWDWDLLCDRHTWSDECKAIFGLPSTAEIDYTLFLSLVAPDDRERIDRLIKESLQQKTDYQVTYRIIWPDESLHWIEARGRGIYNHQGNALRMIGVVFDRTAQKQAEEIQQEADRQIRTILNSVTEGFSHVDQNWHITYMNEPLERLAKIPREEALGQVVWEAYPILIGSVVEQTFHQVMETRRPAHCEFYDTHLQQWVEFHVYPADDGGITVFSLNITERYELEQKKDAFLCMASHELRTPLTALKGNLQLIDHRMQKWLADEHSLLFPEEREVREQIARFAQRALRQANVESRLLNDLLDAISIRSHTLRVILEPCDLGEIICGTIQDLQETVETSRLNVEWLEQHEIPVMADKIRIGQVLANYITNALKYSAASQPVTIGVSCTPEEVRVWVKDQGPGLTTEAQEHIWERFAPTGDFATYMSRGGGGLGLSLYINRAILLQHGGRVGVESQPSHGATFWFTLPCGKKAVRKPLSDD